VKLTTDDAFKEKGSVDVIYADYKNIVKVVQKGSRVYVDDGLISLVVDEIGNLTNEAKIGPILYIP